MQETEIDRRNRQFWDEPCGSVFAKNLGIEDTSEISLREFDRNYFKFYPYLVKHLRPEEMKGKRVLEVGLGYGTVGQFLATQGADFHGLDIAEGPVRMMNARLGALGLEETAVQGNMLDCPFPAESFDFLVSIGCFHHTGDMQRCIDETHRILRPGGTAIVMVYNRFSFRQWKKWPLETFRQFRVDGQYSPAHGEVAPGEAIVKEHSGYDVNHAGEAAPETVFTSVSQLAQMFSQFSDFRCWKENCDDVTFCGKLIWPRKWILLQFLAPMLGLDLYARAVK
jgi:SAM-dependent methyltransferase